VVYRDIAKAPVNLAAPMNILEHWLGKPNKVVESLQSVHYYVMGDCDARSATRATTLLGISSPHGVAGFASQPTARRIAVRDILP
jgi:hypothetical protein